MKKLLAITLLCAFVLNGFSLSAWAAPCPMEKMASKTALQDKMPPCHDMQKSSEKQEKEMPCCKGICMCKHASFSPIPFFIGEANLTVQKPQSDLSPAFEQNLNSLTWSPPRRPPKLIS